MNYSQAVLLLGIPKEERAQFIIDMDIEVEMYYGKPIEFLKKEFFTMDAFRQKAALVLEYQTYKYKRNFLRHEIIKNRS